MECSIPGDYRSKLLNEGIQTAAGRFLAFLDYDDIIYPHAYELLIDTLINEQVAIAFGRIIISHVKPQKNNFYYTVRKEHIFNGETKYQLMQGNFCPIHSFVLDRKLIPREDLFFSEESVKFEDYHFLLRIVARYSSAFSDINEIVGEYIMRLDGSNTVSIHSATDRKKVQEWEAATRWIEEEKKKIFMNISVHDFNRLLEEMQKKGNFDSPVLQEILQSRSWKITAPLRWITQKIKAWRNNG
jgi:glycosyltransferase involved in cell wall biosynthesis